MYLSHAEDSEVKDNKQTQQVHRIAFMYQSNKRNAHVQANTYILHEENRAYVYLFIYLFH